MNELLFNWAMGLVIIRYAVLAVEGIIRVLEWIITPREPRPQRVHKTAVKYNVGMRKDKNPLI